MFGGINKPKHHLARVACKDVVVFVGCPLEVTIQMQVALEAIKEQNVKRDLG